MFHSGMRVLSVFTVLVALAACEKQPPIVTPLAAQPDIVTVKLAQAADKASKALDTIAGIEQMRTPIAPAPENYRNAPPNLMQPVSLRWSGPIELVAKTLADQAGLRFRVKGSQPAAPLVVNVDAYQQPILHILRDIGLQAGQRADLSVDPSGGAIELRYGSREVGAVNAGELSLPSMKGFRDEAK